MFASFSLPIQQSANRVRYIGRLYEKLAVLDLLVVFVVVVAARFESRVVHFADEGLAGVRQSVSTIHWAVADRFRNSSSKNA